MFKLCLPLVLTNDCAILRQFFPPDQVEFIKETCREAAQKEAYELTEDDLELRFHANMCLVVDLMLSAPELANICRAKLSEAVSS